MTREVRVYLSEEDADDERLETLAGYLRGELLKLDVDDVAALRVGQPPPGARVFDVVAVGGLLVTLGGSVDALRSVVDLIRGWLARGEGEGARYVRVEIDGDAIELSNATAAERKTLFDLFVASHAIEKSEQWPAA